MNSLLTGQETERLIFRLLERSDFDNWMPLFEKKEAGLYLGMDSTLSTRQKCEEWFKKSFSRYDNNLGGMNVLVDKITKKMIGQCGLLIQYIEGEEYMEIGYSILPEYWGRGYASEATQKCKEFAFANDFKEELISMIHIDNIGSQKVAIKNGMRVYKEFDSYLGMPTQLFKVNITIE